MLQLSAPVAPTSTSLLPGTVRRTCSERAHTCTPQTDLRAPPWAVRTKKAETGPKSKNAFDQLGLSLLEAGSDLPEESNLGAAMVKCGEALNVVAEAMVSWVRTAV